MSTESGSTKIRRWSVVILFVSAVILYVALLCASAATRKPWNDEAMSADAGYNLAFRGDTGVSFYDEQASGYAGVSRHSYYIFPLQLCVLALWYHIVPFTLFDTRVLSILWNAVMLMALYVAFLRLIRDRNIALLAVVIAALNYHVMTAASFGRYDTMVAALGYASYAVYLSLRERDLRWALLLSNALVVAAGATHPNGIIYFAGLWFLILWNDRRALTFDRIAIAAIPYFAGGVLWASYIFRDFTSFRIQMARNSGGRIGLLHPLRAVTLEFQRRLIPGFGLGAHSAGHEGWIIRLKALSLVAFVLGAIGCAVSPGIRRNRQYTQLFWLTGIHWFLLTFWESMKFTYYFVHILPLLAALVAIPVVTFWRTGRPVRWVLAGALALLFAVETGGIAAKIRLNDYARVYYPAVAYLKQHAKPGDEIFAVCSLGFGYGFDSGFIDDDSLGFTSGKMPEWIVMEEIFDGQHELMKTLAPEKLAHVESMLHTYKLVYRNSEYRIYERPRT